MLNKGVLTLEFVDEILKCDHSSEAIRQYFPATEKNNILCFPWSSHWVLIVVIIVVGYFQADRDVIALAVQEQLDLYPAMKACKCKEQTLMFWSNIVLDEASKWSNIVRHAKCWKKMLDVDQTL